MQFILKHKPTLIASDLSFHGMSLSNKDNLIQLLPLDKFSEITGTEITIVDLPRTAKVFIEDNANEDNVIYCNKINNEYKFNFNDIELYEVLFQNGIEKINNNNKITNPSKQLLDFLWLNNIIDFCSFAELCARADRLILILEDEYKEVIKRINTPETIFIELVKNGNLDNTRQFLEYLDKHNIPSPKLKSSDYRTLITSDRADMLSYLIRKGAYDDTLSYIINVCNNLIKEGYNADIALNTCLEPSVVFNHK